MTKTAVNAAMTRPSRRTAPGLTARGKTSAAAPRISIMFARLLPITLPTAMPGTPVNAALRLTSSSGRDVPKPTMVRPITIGETSKRQAGATAPRTTISPPATRSTNPATREKSIMNPISPDKDQKSSSARPGRGNAARRGRAGND